VPKRPKPNRLFALALFLLFVHPCAAQKSSASKAELDAITARGRLLAEYDVAAWHSTDAVQALNPDKASVGRYIGRKTDTGWVVEYGHLNSARDRFQIAYEASQGARPDQFVVTKLDPPREDKGFYLFAARAIEAALANFQGAGVPYNVYVLPADDGQIYVYFVPGQTSNDVYYYGADARYLISADGLTIVEQRQLHKSLLQFNPKPQGVKTLASGYHTHVLSDVPEDTDVFYVLNRHPLIPEYIGTKKRIYVIATDGTIAIGK